MKDIQSKIDRTLESIDNIKKINAPSFFETRLIARMQRELVAEKTGFVVIKKPAWIITTLSFLLLINIYLIRSNKTEIVAKNKQQEPASIQDFANDYQLDINTSQY